MNQSIFIIKHDYLSNPESGKDYVKDLIYKNCKTEKLALIYDPLAEDFFTHVASNNRDMLELIVSDFYTACSTRKKSYSLKWYQLDEVCLFSISFLSPLLYELDSKFGAYLIGCLPLLNYKPDMYLYFCMSNYEEIEDTYLLLSGKEYINYLSLKVIEFNNFVNEHNSK